VSERYDTQIIRAIEAADRPLRHRDLAELLAPGDAAAWNNIGTSLTKLYRAGLIDREKTDGRYWHYRPKQEEHVTEPTTFEQWAILELMGHVKLAGLVTEEEHFGAKLGRIDIPNGDGFTTQYFTGGSIYRLTPTTEEIARAVNRWELPAPAAHAATDFHEDVEPDNDYDEEKEERTYDRD